MGVLLAAALPLLLPLLLPPLPFRDDAPGGAYRAEGLFDPAGSGLGIYSPETLPDGTTYRWTNGSASFTFPYAAFAGRHAHIKVRTAANWAPGQQPATVTMSVNGLRVASFLADRDFQVHTYKLDTSRLPTPYIHSAHIQVDLNSPATRIAGDPRPLGIVVDYVELLPERSRFERLLEVGSWILGTLIVLLVALRRHGMVWGSLFGASALLTAVVLHLTYLPRAIPLPVEVALGALAWLIAGVLAPRRWPLAGCVLAFFTLWMLFAGRMMGDWQMDDAYISYRYAWNLVHGHGLVYNPGEVVEGYTNFLWTMFAAGALTLGLEPASVMLAANIALSMALLALTYIMIARLAGKTSLWPLLAVILLATDISVIQYGARGSGMEAMAFAVLLMSAAVALWGTKPHYSPKWRAIGGLALALAFMTRPEGALAVVIFLAARLLQDWSSGKRAVLLLGAAALPFLVLVVPYEVWRISFYGYPFPNTFYAKTGMSAALLQRGWEQTTWFRFEHWLTAGMTLVAIVYVLVELSAFVRRRSDAAKSAAGPAGVIAPFATLVLLQTLYIISVGGDYFPPWRFFVPVIAPLTILGVEGLRLVFHHMPVRRTVRATSATLLIVALGLTINETAVLLHPAEWYREMTKLHSTYVDSWGSAGLWLRANTPPDTLTATLGAGAIAYYSRQPVLDALGLNDLHIGHLEVENMGEGRAGHEKRDPVYVLNRKPDYLFALGTYMGAHESRVNEEYTREMRRSPTGIEHEWWVRKNE